MVSSLSPYERSLLRCSVPTGDDLDNPNTVKRFRTEVRRVQNHTSAQRSRRKRQEESTARKEREKAMSRVISKLQAKVGALELLLLEETQARERVEAYILTLVN